MQRFAAALLAFSSLTPLLPGSVWGCEEHAHVRAILASLPAALSGVRVEVHKTMRPQVVLANPTAHILEVLDADGTAFVRIGPAGVEGNLAAKAWYETYSPGAVAPATVGSAPRWVRVATEPNFGWFEERLDAKQVALPAEVIAAGEPADIGHWQLPLRVDGEAVALHGLFRYEPPPQGMFVARLTSPASLAPGVQIRLLPGRVAGVMVQNATRSTLHVSGIDGEPFLRIGPDGVDANVHSRTWWVSGRASGRRSQGLDALPDWQRVAAVPRFSWIDPRAQAADGQGHEEPVVWQIPVELDQRLLAVTGQTSWRSRPAGD